MRVVVAGGSGFLGRAATRRLLADGHQVQVLTRNARARLPEGATPVVWDGATVPDLEADAVVGLTGKSVATRWSPTVKEQLRSSRIGPTKAIVDWMETHKAPKVFVTASASGYYGLRPEGPQPESSGPGSDFLAQLCAEWERTAMEAESLGVRVVRLRFGIALGTTGGALPRMLTPFRLGLGGPVGSGTQPFPWVHRDDIAAAIAWAVSGDASGAYNVAAPQATDMRGFARSLAAALHRPALLGAPAWALKLLYGKGAAQVILGGQELPPDRILKAGFRFRHPDLPEALRDVLANA